MAYPVPILTIIIDTNTKTTLSPFPQPLRNTLTIPGPKTADCGGVPRLALSVKENE